MHNRANHAGYFSPDEDGISRQYSELYGRGITIKFQPKGKVR
jgi:hypothetical protein